MFRKHLRFRRRIFAGLAFAALAAPTAAQAQSGVFVDGGPAPVSNVTVSSYQPSYLRYHEVGAPVAAGQVARSERSYTAGAQLTPEVKRWLAMAQATRYQQESAAISERSNTDATITPLQADGLRWNAMARFYEQNKPSVAISERSNGVKGPDPSLVSQVALSTSSGFDWSDAGIGASTVFGAALLLGIAIFFTRRNQHSGLTSA
jgi:hypothetical protein